MRAHQKEVQSAADAQIAKAKIAVLEEKTRTLSTAEKLFRLFDRIDQKFRTSIESGRYSFTAFLREFDYGTLKAIAKDDDRIALAPSTNTRSDNEGAIIEVFIHIKPEVFTK